MKSIYIIGILFLLISIVDGTTTWDSDIYWHPLSSLSWYNFAENQTSLDHIYMDSQRFTIPSQVSGQSDINFSVWNRANITLNSWNHTYVNFTNTINANMTVCGLNSTIYYNVTQNRVSLWSELEGACITFNVTEATDTLIVFGDNVGIREVRYSAYNGTGYEYDYNQSINFRCQPIHTSCIPDYQNNTQWLFNYTNTRSSSRTLYLTLNESIQGYTIKVYNESNSTLASNLSTSRLSLGSVGSSAIKRLWFWIDTWYPFRDWNATIIMEAG